MSLAVAATFLGGLLLLVGGAELLVRGASRLAIGLGVAPLVIGLTVVAWGTGSPELAVALKAAVQGRADIAVGNVVGSNIANILLILGLAAVISPLRVSARLIRLDVPLMIGVSILTYVLALDGGFGAFDGALFLTALVAYTAWTIRESRRAGRALREEYEREFGSAPGAPSRAGFFVANAALVGIGLVLLVLGSDWLVDGASAIAEALGFSELVIGLTIVAVGTSLPELATSAVASARGERDIAVGNAVGSNIFNILAVLGITALVAPEGIAVAPEALGLDIPIMIAVAVACVPVFFTGHAIDRWQGALFVTLYGGYVAFLVLQSTQHGAVRGFNAIMVAFVLPLVVFTLGLVLYRAWRNPQSRT